jgi:hypothetical protein
VAYDPITGKFTPDPVVLGGTPFGQSSAAQAPQTPMSYGGTSFGQAGSAAPTASNEYQSALNDFNKTLKQAEKTLAIAKKSGNKNEIKAAKGYVDLLKGDINQVLKIAGGISGGTVAATGGKGAYSLSQIKAYMDANNGAFPPDLNTIASGITASDLGNLQNQYNAGKGLGGGAAADGAADADARKERQSAFDLLKLQFDEYGLGALVEPLRGLIQEGISPSEFAVRLRQTEPYKKRFAANAARISKGLRALSESDYINLEDDYQTIMRNYGLPASYYTKGELGRQEGFEKFIGGDVSPAELEERIVTAQKRVLDAAPEVTTALKQFYPDIKNGEILAYTLDPEKGLADIRKKVTAAEIGGAALGAQVRSNCR